MDAKKLKEDELMSIEVSAKYLGGISIWTVRAWISQKRLAKTKVGRRTMIRRSELDNFIERENSKSDGGDDE